MKCYKLKIDFQIIFKLFSKLKHLSRNENDDLLFMQIIKLLLSIRKFYKISLQQISNENLRNNFKRKYENIFSKLCQNIFTCNILKKEIKNVYKISFKKKYKFSYILKKLEYTFSNLITCFKYYPIKEIFSFPFVNENNSFHTKRMNNYSSE